MPDLRRFQFGTAVLALQIIFILCFAFLAEYDVTAQPDFVDVYGSGARHLEKMYPPFQDVHVMIFIGFGYLMTFLARYGLSAVGLNMLLSALVIQWAYIVRGVINAEPEVVDGHRFPINIDGYVDTPFVVGALTTQRLTSLKTLEVCQSCDDELKPLFTAAASAAKYSIPVTEDWDEEARRNPAPNFFIPGKPSKMVAADFAAATVLISLGAVLGKTSPMQLLIMAMMEVPIAQINGWICHEKFHATDTGESMFIHAFGAYFGLAVAAVLYDRKVKDSPKAGSVYHSDLFSIIGTLFLWLYWPSFNGGGSSGDEQHRAYVNTYLSLCGCTIATFGLSAIYNRKGKFSTDHIQNATVAGGVAVGTTAAMPLEPWGAILMGVVSGLISVTGFRFIQGFIERKLRIHDTCGVHNLHGMPGVFAAIAGAIMAAMSSFGDWGISLYEIFPNQAPFNGTAEYDELLVTYASLGATPPEPADGWSPGKQGGYQMAAIGLTLAMSVVGGVVTGFVMKLPVWNNIEDGSDLFDDGLFWNVADQMPAMEGEESATQMETYKPTVEGERNGTEKL